jgi:hypothetical protein
VEVSLRLFLCHGAPGSDGTGRRFLTDVLAPRQRYSL